MKSGKVEFVLSDFRNYMHSSLDKVEGAVEDQICIENALAFYATCTYLHTYIYYWALWKCRKFRNWNSKKMTTYLAVGVNFF